jgi:hypothetical protein
MILLLSIFSTLVCAPTRQCCSSLLTRYSFSRACHWLTIHLAFFLYLSPPQFSVFPDYLKYSPALFAQAYNATNATMSVPIFGSVKNITKGETGRCVFLVVSSDPPCKDDTVITVMRILGALTPILATVLISIRSARHPDAKWRRLRIVGEELKVRKDDFFCCLSAACRVSHSCPPAPPPPPTLPTHGRGPSVGSVMGFCLSRRRSRGSF